MIVGMTGWVMGAAAAAGVMGFGAYAVRGRSSSIFGESVYRGDATQPAIALTFDDGPSESTPALLEILESYHVKATFFMCGWNVVRCKAIAREVRTRGHEIGNHSLSHARFDFKSTKFIYDEIAQTQDVIASAAGIGPRWFRAPYGVRWFGVGPAQRKLGLTGAMWTVLGRDWRLSAPEISDRILRGTKNGAILCLHDGREILVKPDVSATLDAVKQVIPQLLRRGFRFETLSQMLPRAPAPGG
jgi:peptidoglycan-N-acetylglucosamine deacetylase